jgi:hypothetical protein
MMVCRYLAPSVLRIVVQVFASMEHTILHRKCRLRKRETVIGTKLPGTAETDWGFARIRSDQPRRERSVAGEGCQFCGNFKVDDVGKEVKY